jgi:small GTP-binding protein
MRKDSTKINEEINKKKREILTKNYNVIINNENEIDTKDKVNLPIKAIIIGDSLVGKTSIIYWLLHNQFIDEYQISHSFNMEKMSFIIEKTNIELTIIDIPGNGQFDDLLQKNINGCKVLIFVYSIDNKNTFESLNNLLSKINETKILKCLLGNKLDKLDNENKREVTKNEAEQFIEDKCFDFFQEVSAKNGTNIIEIFKKIIEKIYKNNELLKIGNEESLSSDINFVANNSLDIDDINNNNNKKGRNCCCCCCF